MISCYADICAMRHPKEGAPLVACEHSSIPVINAGDGGHQHPTQTLTDLLTIRSLKGQSGQSDDRSLRRLEIRTYRTLSDSCSGSLSGNVEFVLISPEELRVPSYIREDVLDKNNIPFKEVDPSGRRSARTGYSLHDPCTERAFLQ